MESDISQIRRLSDSNRGSNITSCKINIWVIKQDIIGWNKEIQELNESRQNYNIIEWNEKIRHLRELIDFWTSKIQFNTDHLNAFLEEDKRRGIERPDSEFDYSKFY